MRTTSCCSVEQALTPEAATVLKHSISLAKRRGHAQVTPLHVASILLSSAGSTNLLRRACFKSHPQRRSTTSLHCRTLDLCFNVALNRLPSSPPPPSLFSSSSSAISIAASTAHRHFPSLSNALVAALKRAQAHQRRGSVEFHNNSHQYYQQQQQSTTMIAVKVELEQLVLSILDDPSVSRVMREAGFSSTAVKQYIEDDNSVFEYHPSSSSTFLQTQLVKSCTEINPEDVKIVIDVMLRKNGRCNTVIVGDNDSGCSSTGEIVAELMRRIERGEVTEELKHTQFIRVQLSSLHIKSMSRDEVDNKVRELSARIQSVANEKGKNWRIVVYVGDLKWAIVQEEKEEEQQCRDGFKPVVEHLIKEIGKMVEEFRNAGTGPEKIWIMATANYQTYMKCQIKYPQLVNQWSLQAVVVPSAGLSLTLQSPSGADSRVAKVSQYPFQLLKEEHEEQVTIMCVECSLNYEKEASIFNHSSHLPSWLQSHNLHKENSIELKKKWSRLCRRLHDSSHHMQMSTFPSMFNQMIADDLRLSTSKMSMEPKRKSFLNMKEIIKNQEYKDAPLQHCASDMQTSLDLGSSFFADSATSKDQAEGSEATDHKRLRDQLERNVYWHSEIIPSIADAMLDCKLTEKKGTWLLLQGNDDIAKIRIAEVAAELICGSKDKLVHIKSRQSASSAAEIFMQSLSKHDKYVFYIEVGGRRDADFRRMFQDCMKNGYLADLMGRKVCIDHAIFLLATNESSNAKENTEKVFNLRFSVEEHPQNVIKRKLEYSSDSQEKESKRPRACENILDLNICVNEEEDDTDVPSDITQESDTRDNNNNNNLSTEFIRLIGPCFTLDLDEGRSYRRAEELSWKINLALKKARCNGEELEIDRTGERRVDESFNVIHGSPV